MADNTLYYGDNLDILREYIDAESVDLIYLDPPFNSNRNYNVLFKNEKGKESEAQIVVFEDAWHWNHVAEETYQDLVVNAPTNVARMIASLRDFIGTNQMMAYLVMMAARLVELHRVLRPTGSLYLHCDPTASHYLKIVAEDKRNCVCGAHDARLTRDMLRACPNLLTQRRGQCSPRTGQSHRFNSLRRSVCLSWCWRFGGGCTAT